MSNLKHTRGPWQLTFGEHDAAIHAGATIAMVDDTMGGWKENATLMAAAPALHDALLALVLELTHGFNTTPKNKRLAAAVEEALAVLDDAKGKQ